MDGERGEEEEERSARGKAVQCSGAVSGGAVDAVDAGELLQVESSRKLDLDQHQKQRDGETEKRSERKTTILPSVPLFSLQCFGSLENPSMTA